MSKISAQRNSPANGRARDERQAYLSRKKKNRRFRRSRTRGLAAVVDDATADAAMAASPAPRRHPRGFFSPSPSPRPLLFSAAETRAVNTYTRREIDIRGGPRGRRPRRSYRSRGRETRRRGQYVAARARPIAYAYLTGRSS